METTQTQNLPQSAENDQASSSSLTPSPLSKDLSQTSSSQNAIDFEEVASTREQSLKECDEQIQPNPQSLKQNHQTLFLMKVWIHTLEV